MKKTIISMITALLLTASLGFAACGKKTDKPEEHVHDWTVQSSTANCGEAGVTVYVCGCGETKTEETPASGNHAFSGKRCSVCGYVDFGGMTMDEALAEYGYYAEDKDSSNTYSTGDVVYFGSYPQSKVEDASVLSALGQQAGILPSEGNGGDWTSYGYYADGAVSDYMYYKDVTLNGKDYRGVYLLNYRPYYSGLPAGTAYSYIDDGGYNTETVYWFEYAPIGWNVLEYRDGSLLLGSKYCLEAQPYQDVYEVKGADYCIPETSHYVNEWQYSSLRAFLNGAFYGAAFNGEQQSLIQTVTLDNVTTGYAADAQYQINQKNTEDRVFLLSYQDVTNTAYGYSSRGASRVRSYTDYAQVQGLRPSAESQTEDGDPACSYSLRSAGDQSYGVVGVSKNGSAGYTTLQITDESVDGVAINGDLGVLPALYIRVGKAAQGVWKDFTFEYTDDNGGEALSECSVYIPASYTGGAQLPLITYVADSSYTTMTLAQYKLAQCPKAWITAEKTSENPAFFLMIGGSPTASLALSVIDKVVADYRIDEARLYLTGQSMGGILDFALNDSYPEKFAATVYVDCQPGGEVHDEQYDQIIANAKFADQKFVYIASRKDELAAQGQDDVERALIDNGISAYGKLYGLDHKGGDTLNAAVKEVLDEGYSHNFFGFTQVTSSGNTAAEHMQSFQYGYAIDAIYEWLLAQHK